jgi:hypothetical protein
MVGVIRHGARLTIDPDFLHQDRQLLGCTYGSAREQTHHGGYPNWLSGAANP